MEKDKFDINPGHDEESESSSESTMIFDKIQKENVFADIDSKINKENNSQYLDYLNTNHENIEKDDSEKDTVESDESDAENNTTLESTTKAGATKKKRKITFKEKYFGNASKTSLRIFWAILLSVFIIAISTYLAIVIVQAIQDYTGIAKNNIEVEVTIPKNSDTNHIASLLEKNGIIETPWLFIAYVNAEHDKTEFIPGTYTFSPKMSYSEIVYEMQAKKIVLETVTLTFIEGMTAEQIGAKLEENYVCRAQDFLAAYKTMQNKYDFEQYLTKDERKYYQLEGFLFPDTYDFYTVEQLKKTKEYDTSKQAMTAAKKFFNKFDTEIKPYIPRMREVGLSLNQTITLASMIEKEANSMESMKMVSSVFHNRLKNSQTYPKLQSDVTIFYVENFIKPHYPVDSYVLMQETFDAYNTYVTYGLPVGPICNPGKMAIEAALYPADTDYFYFLTDEKMEKFYYAETDEEHEKNKKLAGLA